MFYIAAAPLFYLASLADNSYKELCAVLIISLVGFLLVYLMQQIPWYYHLLPALSLAWIVCSVLLAVYIRQTHSRLSDYFFSAGIFSKTKFV